MLPMSHDWLWLGPSLATLRYVMHFRFYGWHHVFTKWQRIGLAKGVYSKWLNRVQHGFYAAAHTLTVCCSSFDLELWPVTLVIIRTSTHTGEGLQIFQGIEGKLILRPLFWACQLGLSRSARSICSAWFARGMQLAAMRPLAAVHVVTCYEDY